MLFINFVTPGKGLRSCFDHKLLVYTNVKQSLPSGTVSHLGEYEAVAFDLEELDYIAPPDPVLVFELGARPPLML